MNERFSASGLILLLVAPLLLSLVPMDVSASDEARSGTPDLQLHDITISAGGAIDTGSGIILATGAHTISIIVSNSGTAAAGGTLVVSNGTISTITDIVDTITVPTIQPGGSSSPILVSWSAHSGMNQRLKAVIAADQDPNSLNDVGTLDFGVIDHQAGEVSSHDSPEPEVGQSTVRMTGATLEISAAVRNVGVTAANATLRIRLTNASGSGHVLDSYSNTINLQPGTLSSISQSSLLSASLDVSSLFGRYNLDVDLLFNGSQSDDTISAVAIQPIEFSPHNAKLTSPADRSTQPGETAILTFILMNIGNAADTFQIGLTSSRGWTDISQDGDSTAVVAAGGMTSVVVQTQVPEDADRSLSERVDLTMTSDAAGYVLTGVARVMAGDLYRVELEAPHMDTEGLAWLDGSGGIGGVILTAPGSNHLDADGVEVDPVVSFIGGGGSGASAGVTMDGSGSVLSVDMVSAGTGYTSAPSVLIKAGANAVHHTPIVPGTSATVAFNVHNTGNVPGSFELDAGLSSSAVGWQVDLSSSSTDVIPVGGNRTVNVEVSAPSLSNPLDPASRLRDGESLELWFEAQPTVGGATESTTESVVVQPTIIVDPGLATDEIILSEEVVLGAVGATGVERFVDMDIQVVHNLVNGPDDEVGVEIEVGDLTFTPLTSGGALEAQRWNASTSVSSTSLGLGEVESASLGILGPSDMLPQAGTLSIPVIASPTISIAQVNADVVATPVTRLVEVIIPEIAAAELSEPGKLLLTPGESTNHNFTLNNTGNDLTSYMITIEEGYPAEWDIGLGSSATSLQILSVPSAMHNHPSANPNSSVKFVLNITIPSNSPAGVENSLTLRVADIDTGQWLTSLEVEMITQEKISASIDVDEVRLEVALTDNPPFARIHIENTGNVLTSFDLWMDTSQSGDVAFVLDSDDELPIAAGYTASVKIRVTPSSDASSDFNHYARLHVTTDTGVNESVLINVSINASKAIMITIPPTPDVIPGENVTFTVNLNNSGNLMQNFTLEFENDAGWEHVLSSSNFSLIQEGEANVTVTVVIPPLGGESAMSNGEQNPITIRAFDSTTGELVGAASSQMTIAAVFEMEHIGWDEMAYFHRWGEWRFESMVMNTGNKDVTVEMDYSILRPGGAGVEQAWEVNLGAPSLLNLPVGEWVPLTLVVSATDSEPDALLQGLLVVEMRPVDAGVTGSAVLQADLFMSRMHSTGEPKEIDPLSGSTLESLTWSHIPLGSSGNGVYEIELCATERMINTSELTDPGFHQWNFYLQVSGESKRLDMAPICGSSGGMNAIQLAGASPWVLQTIPIVISTPVPPYIAPMDGWNLTFRLYNMDEHENYTVYTEATFGIRIQNIANPSVSNLRLSSGDSIEEDQDVKVLLDVTNTGTASAIAVSVTLECRTGAEILSDPTIEIPILASMEERTLEWVVQPTRLDWWEHDSGIECEAVLDSILASGNDEADDNSEMSAEVISWAPNSIVTVVGFALMLLVTGILLRVGMQSEKFMQAAAFSGAITAGLGFHLGALFEGAFSTWFSLGCLFASALWIMWIAWRSGEEFQLVHEDYQRAKLGQSTLYSDHFSALKSARRQLTGILSVPVLGTMVIVLGLPPRLNPDAANITMLSAYVLVVTLGVWGIIRWAEKTYGAIYSKMIEIGNRTEKMQNDLGDPARLLTELARSGLDLSAILNDNAEEGDAS